MAFLRIISLFCIALLLGSVQCRAKCVVTPDVQATKQCPLHKHKAPETQKCTHAPQWDADETKQFVATLDETVLDLQLEPLQIVSIPSSNPPARFARPPLILRI